jgi:hypothetical protein
MFVGTILQRQWVFYAMGHYALFDQLWLLHLMGLVKLTLKLVVFNEFSYSKIFCSSFWMSDQAVHFSNPIRQSDHLLFLQQQYLDL